MKDFPKKPGVYFFKDENSEIIYVGKAKNLKNRLSSYFNKGDKSPKTKVLVSKIKTTDFIITNTEVEALLLENKLIKENSPKYNINLKDDKTYAYIKITDHKFPRIQTARKVTKKGKYFGPYTDGFKRSILIKALNKHFKLCTKNCMSSKSKINYDIGLCNGACIGKELASDYKKRVDEAIKVLKGNIKDFEKQIFEKMQEYIKKEQFELAKIQKEILESIKLLTQKQQVDDIKQIDQDVIVKKEKNSSISFLILHIKKGTILKKESFTLPNEELLFSKFLTNYYYEKPIPHEIIVSEEFWLDEREKQILEEYLEQLAKRKAKIINPKKGDKKRLVELALKNIKTTSSNLLLLKDKLKLKKIPIVIESFDISNLKDKHIVAGMVQFVDGMSNKNNYRRFKIKTKDSQDDFGAMKEVIYRRYKHLKETNKIYPDLIMVDGGLGQLNSAKKALQELNIKIDLISLVKREEEIYKDEEVIQLDKQKEPMLLLRKIRDETHRFAISYNKLLRSKELKEDFLRN